MNEDQMTSGANSKPGAPAPPVSAPVMDVVRPPAASEPPVVSAPPEEPAELPVGDDIAAQIGADSPALPPTKSKAPDAGDSPDDLIQAEIEHEEAAVPPPVAKTPKSKNPAQAAVVVTLIMTVLLAGLAVFAYMATQS